MGFLPPHNKENLVVKIKFLVSKLTRRAVLLLISSFLISGCIATTTTTFDEEWLEFDTKLLKAMKTNEGHHISTVIQRMGPPTYKTSDEAGGTIYVWTVDPVSLPVQPPPATITPPSSHGTLLTQTTSRMLYWQRIEKEKDHRYQSNRWRQKMLAMKRMFYVRPNGTIYLAHLTYQ